MSDFIENWEEDHIVSVPRAVYRYKQYLMRERNFQNDYALEKAADYGLGMLQSANFGKPVDFAKAETMFREIAEISQLMANVCREHRTEIQDLQ